MRRLIGVLTMLLLGACVPAEPPATAAAAPPAAAGAPGATGFRQVVDQPVALVPVTFDTASWGVARRMIRAGRLPARETVRPEEFLQAFGWSYPAVLERPFVSLLPAPWDANRRLLQIGIRAMDGPGARPTAAPPRNLVFLVDTSASMAPADRLPLVQEALRGLLPSLGERDRISILTYGSGSRTLLDGMRGDRKLFIETALDDLRPGGNLAGGDAITTAYALAAKNLSPGAINRVLLLTDGDLELGVPGPALEPLLMAQRERGVQFSSIFLGTPAGGDGRVRALTRAGGGSHGYAATAAEALRLIGDEFAINVTPVARNLTVEVAFNSQRLSAWRLLATEGGGGASGGVMMGTGRVFTAIFELTSTDNFNTALDPRSYGRDNPSAPGEPDGTQYATLRLRFRGADGSAQVVTRRVGERDAARSFAAGPADARFGAAVAGFAQRLRGDISWPMAEIAATAQAAIGDNPGGQRPDFVAVVRAAAALR